MNLSTTPFTKEEVKKELKLVKFNELGLDINFLNDADLQQKNPSGNNYKFGVIIGNQYFWYFNGKSVAKSRAKMREIWSALLDYHSNSNQTPFVFKSK